MIQPVHFLSKMYFVCNFFICSKFKVENVVTMRTYKVDAGVKADSLTHAEQRLQQNVDQAC